MPGLFIVYLYTLFGDAVYARCFHAKVILVGGRAKKLVTYLGRRPMVLMTSSYCG
jgi:hypothetical protein